MKGLGVTATNAKAIAKSQTEGWAQNRHYDVIIIGSGISGSFIAQAATKNGARVLMFEAGKDYNKNTYHRDEIDGNS